MLPPLPPAPCTKSYKDRSTLKFSQIAGSAFPDSCGVVYDLLGCRLRRARSASRSKRRRAVVGGSQKLVGAADESAIGSAKWPEGVLALPRAFFFALVTYVSERTQTAV